jgi:hypothetical protein
MTQLTGVNKMIMTYEEKLIHYATAPRATAGEITSIVDGRFVTKWAGRLRGIFVSMNGEWKFTNKQDALALARAYRQSCFDEAKSKGLF